MNPVQRSSELQAVLEFVRFARDRIEEALRGLTKLKFGECRCKKLAAEYEHGPKPQCPACTLGLLREQCIGVERKIVHAKGVTTCPYCGGIALPLPDEPSYTMELGVRCDHCKMDAIRFGDGKWWMRRWSGDQP